MTQLPPDCALQQRTRFGIFDDRRGASSNLGDEGSTQTGLLTLVRVRSVTQLPLSKFVERDAHGPLESCAGVAEDLIC